MGSCKDRGTSIVESIDENTGYPKDQFGHLLDPYDIQTGERIDPIRPGDKLFNLTSPYGFLHWAIGDSDDFVCFDFAVIEDRFAVLHSVINSETGGFIQDDVYAVVPLANAIAIAESMTDSALEWCVENDIELDKEGWNQKPEAFFNAVRLEVRAKRKRDIHLKLVANNKAKQRRKKKKVYGKAK